MLKQSNSHNCPKKLWGKMDSEQKSKYNSYMQILTRFNEWCVMNGETLKDPNIIAHNAVFSIVDEFYGDIVDIEK